MEELRSKLADVSVSSSGQSSREFSNKSIATKEKVNHSFIHSFMFQLML